MPVSSFRSAGREGNYTRGFSLVELAIALAILSLVVLLLLRMLSTQARVGIERFEQALLQRADAALTGFAAARHRLPCPDTDRDGRENCSDPAQAGYLPFRDLGLPDARAGQLRYGVLRQAGGGVNLAQAGDRYYPLLAQALPPAAATLPLGNVNGLDFCHQLRLSALLEPSQLTGNGLLHTLANGVPRPVAYAIAAPGRFDQDGDGLPFDGSQVGASGAFDGPQGGGASDRDDRVLAIAPGQFWARLQCGEGMAAAGHAHPNVATASRILAQAGADYARVTELLVDLAEAKVDSATAAVLTATAGLTMAGAKAALATAQALLSLGAMAPVIAATVAAVAANTAAVAAAGVALSRANDALASARAIAARAAAYQQAVRLLSDLIVQRAREADRYGIFGIDDRGVVSQRRRTHGAGRDPLPPRAAADGCGVRGFHPAGNNRGASGHRPGHRRHQHRPRRPPKCRQPAHRQRIRAGLAERLRKLPPGGRRRTR